MTTVKSARRNASRPSSTCTLTLVSGSRNSGGFACERRPPSHSSAVWRLLVHWPSRWRITAIVALGANRAGSWSSCRLPRTSRKCSDGAACTALAFGPRRPRRPQASQAAEHACAAANRPRRSTGSRPPARWFIAWLSRAAMRVFERRVRREQHHPARSAAGDLHRRQRLVRGSTSWWFGCSRRSAAIMLPRPASAAAPASARNSRARENHADHHRAEDAEGDVAARW